MKKKVTILAALIVMISIMALGCTETEKGERAGMLDSQPTQTLEYSNEREVFMGYLEQVNNPNNIQFIYLFDSFGHVIHRGTVMGKTVSATKSTEPYIRAIKDSNTYSNEDTGAENFAGYIPGTPQLMNPSGMFGSDTPGVIWMDPQGNFHEWHLGPYLITSYAMTIEEPVISYSNIDTEIQRKVNAMEAKLKTGGDLTIEEKQYLMEI
ncbi:MAG: hypothetical protein KAQ87_01725 [Candidatus Pacebacteria bacterium]|nr:hypothetical protein [Candidatus Paceibacterota bacterium]